MYLGRVLGSVIASQKSPALRGKTFLYVEKISSSGDSLGSPHVAIDTVQAGPGDVVYLVGSREAALALSDSFVPVDAAVVGFVDDVDRTVSP